MLRIANFNAYKLSPEEVDSKTWESRVIAVREMAPDVLALQEVLVDEGSLPPERWDGAAAELIQRFADDCGLTANISVPGYAHGTTMASNSARPWYTALLWRPDAVNIQRFRPYGAPDFFHGCTTATFDVGASKPLKVASYHGDPYRGGAGGHMRACG